MSDLRQQLHALIQEWRDRAGRVRPLESAPITAEKRAMTAEWMWYTNRADELDALIRAASPPAPQHVSRMCSEGEHDHCGGQVKFANADGADDCFPCACQCHGRSAGPPQEK